MLSQDNIIVTSRASAEFDNLVETDSILAYLEALSAAKDTARAR